MMIRLQYLSKRRSGKLTHVSTFLHSASYYNHDAILFLSNSENIKPEFIVKVMEDGGYAIRECAAASYFQSKQHRNIIEYISTSVYNNNPLRWIIGEKQKDSPHDDTIHVIIQKYVNHGNVREFNLERKQWISLLLQLIFGYIDLCVNHDLICIIYIAYYMERLDTILSF